MEKNLNITLTHEFYRCSNSLKNFNILFLNLNKSSSMTERIDCYNYYVDFLSHLYEFYAGIVDNHIKLEKEEYYTLYKSKNKKKHEILDNIFLLELQKAFRNRKNRIVRGFKDELNLNVKFYDSKIPQEFSKHFRIIRNRRNHADYRRPLTESEITLIDFYKKYSKHVLILYNEAKWLWQVDLENYKWGEIDKFSLYLISNE